MSLPKSQVGILVSLSILRSSPVIGFLLSGLIVPRSEDHVQVVASLESLGSVAPSDIHPTIINPTLDTYQVAL